MPAVSFITVATDSLFWVRLLVAQVRRPVGPRPYEIIVVDRLSRDGTRAWLRRQPDVRVLLRPHLPWQRSHRHGEEATMRVLAAGLGAIKHPIAFCAELGVGHPRLPTVAGGVFHASYVSRLLHNEAEVIRETAGQATRASYLEPLMQKLRAHYHLGA